MAVIIDAVGTEVRATGVTSINLATLTIGSASNRVLIGFLCLSNQAVTGLQMAWDILGANVAMTNTIEALTPSAGVGLAAIFTLIAPSSGNRGGKASWTGTSDAYFQMMSVSGADQTGGLTTFRNPATATGTTSPIALSITSPVGDMAVDCVCDGDSTGILSAPTQTQIWLDNGNPTTVGGSSRQSASGTANFSWTIAGSSPNWVDVGFSIKSDGTETWISAQPEPQGALIGQVLRTDPVEF